jgi:ribosomal protein L11 methylase PrmA
LRFGASEAVGVEIDRDAIAASLSNARLNGLDGRFRCFLPSDRTEDAGRVQDLRYAAMLRRGAAADPPMAEFRALPEVESAFDIVVANILAGPLVRLAPEIAALARPGAALGLSGVLATQVCPPRRREPRVAGARGGSTLGAWSAHRDALLLGVNGRDVST